MHYQPLFEPRHDKTNKMAVRPAKTQISLGICPVWSESSLSTWRKLGSSVTDWVHSEDWSDWVDAQADLSFGWAHSTLLVLSWSGSFTRCSCLKMIWKPSEHSDQPGPLPQLVWSESLLCTLWVLKDLKLHQADSEDIWSDWGDVQADRPKGNFVGCVVLQPNCYTAMMLYKFLDRQV